MKKRYKKATLDISIGAIVIIVIAFVVLGLGLVLTKEIFSRARGEIPEIFEVAKLVKEPTADTPLTVKKEISIKRGGTEKFDIGFYNNKKSTLENVTISIQSCLSVETGLAEDASNIPVMTSVAQNVASSTPAGYLVYLKEQRKLDAGEYICEVVAKKKDSNLPEDIYEKVQISLTITT